MEEKNAPASQTVVEFEDKKKFNIPVFLLWIAFTISILFAGFLWISTAGLNSTIADKIEEKDNLVTKIGSSKYEGIEKEANAIADAVSTLSLIADENIKTSDLLTDLYSYMTSDVTITSFAVAGDKSISIDGATASYRQVADFIVALKSSDRISEIALNTIAVSSDEGGTANGQVVFTITGTIDRTKKTAKSN